MLNYYLDLTPPTALVDFNMTDERGVVPALRSRITGVMTTELFRGLRVTAQDADGNTAEGIVFAVAGDVVELYLPPAQVAVFESFVAEWEEITIGQYDVAASIAVERQGSEWHSAPPDMSVPVEVAS